MPTPIHIVYGESSGVNGGSSSSSPPQVSLSTYQYLDGGQQDNYTSPEITATITGGAPEVTILWEVTSVSDPDMVVGVTGATTTAANIVVFVPDPDVYTAQVLVTVTDNLGRKDSRTIAVEILKQGNDGDLA